MSRFQLASLLFFLMFGLGSYTSCLGLDISGHLLAPGEEFPGANGELAIDAPMALVGSGNLTDLFNAAAEVWEAAILDDHTVTIHYGWADRIDSFGREILVDQQDSPPYRQTEATLWIGTLADESFPFYMDPTPFDPSEFTTFHTSSRDLGAGEVNTERVYRGGTGLADGAADLFGVLLHEMGHALGMDFENTAYINETADDHIDLLTPLPFAGSRIKSLAGSSHVAPTSALMGIGTDLGERAYPSEIDILGVAQLGQFQNVNLNPLPVPDASGGPGTWIDSFGDGNGNEIEGPNNVAFGPDGNVYISTSDEVIRYSSHTRRRIDVFASAGEREWSIGSHHSWAFGPDGDLYISGVDEQGGVLRYDGQSGKFKDSFAPDLGTIRALAFSPAGELHVLGSDRQRIVVYDWKTGEPIRIASEIDSPVFDILFNPDGDLFLRSRDRFVPTLLRDDGSVFIRDLNDGITLIEGRPTTTTGIEFGVDGNLYAVTNRDRLNQDVRVLDGITGDYLGDFVTPFSGGLWKGEGLTFGPDGYLYVASEGSDEVLVFHGPQTVAEPSTIAFAALSWVCMTVCRRWGHRRAKSTT